jgi:hypothetical protein
VGFIAFAEQKDKHERAADHPTSSLRPRILARAGTFHGLCVGEAIFLQEIRHSLRMLARNPGLSLVAILSVGMGIGVKSAMFSFHDAILLRLLPVPEPGAVVTVSVPGPEESPSLGRLSYPNYRDLGETSRSFEGLVAGQLMPFSFSRSRATGREMRMAMSDSENFFSALHVQPALGRGFAPEEGRVPGRDAVVVLGYDFWKNILGADLSILGSAVLINGIDFRVIGVAPESFTGTDLFVRPEFYVPSMMHQRLASVQHNSLDDREARTWEVEGRLRSGISRQSEEKEMAALWNGLETQYPGAIRNRTMFIRTELEQRVQTRRANAILTVMSSLAAVVSIIACANVANLMLGRARARSREIAIRLALGVSRMRLLRQLLTESLLLAFLGGTLGLGLAYAGIRFLTNSAQAIVPTEIPVIVAPRLVRLPGFGIQLFLGRRQRHSVRSGPSMAKPEDPAGSGAQGFGVHRHSSTADDRAQRARRGANRIVDGNAGRDRNAAGRLSRYSDGRSRVSEDHLITMALDTSFTRYTAAQTHEFYRDLVDRARNLPGVQSVTLPDAIPLARGFAWRKPVIPEGYQFPKGQESAAVATAVVDENYFDTVKTAIVRGRAFTVDDKEDKEDSPPVAIINDVFAATYWPKEQAIGKRVRLNNNAPWLEVVGFARPEKYSNILEPPTPFLYLPFRQQEKPQMSLLVETVNADESPLAGPLRDVVRSLDANQPF